MSMTKGWMDVPEIEVDIEPLGEDDRGLLLDSWLGSPHRTDELRDMLLKATEGWIGTETKAIQELGKYKEQQQKSGNLKHLAEWLNALPVEERQDAITEWIPAIRAIAKALPVKDANSTFIEFPS